MGLTEAGVLPAAEDMEQSDTEQAERAAAEEVDGHVEDQLRSATVADGMAEDGTPLAADVAMATTHVLGCKVHGQQMLCIVGCASDVCVARARALLAFKSLPDLCTDPNRHGPDRQTGQRRGSSCTSPLSLG
jgi:hypothetical protein